MATGVIAPATPVLRALANRDAHQPQPRALFAAHATTAAVTPERPADSSPPIFVSMRGFAATEQHVRSWTQPVVLACGSARVRTLLEEAAAAWPECACVWVQGEPLDRIRGSQRGAASSLDASPEGAALDALCARVCTCNLIGGTVELARLPARATVLCIAYGEDASHEALRRWRQRQHAEMLFVVEKALLDSLTPKFGAFRPPFVAKLARGEWSS